MIKKVDTSNRPVLAMLIISVISIIVILWGRFFLASGQEIGFTLLNFYILIPAVCLLTGALAGASKNVIKWAHPLVCGLWGGIVPLAVYGYFAWLGVGICIGVAAIGVILSGIIWEYQKRG